jgi:hypothetical protein
MSATSVQESAGHACNMRPVTVHTTQYHGGSLKQAWAHQHKTVAWVLCCCCMPAQHPMYMLVPAVYRVAADPRSVHDVLHALVPRWLVEAGMDTSRETVACVLCCCCMPAQHTMYMLVLAVPGY